MGLSCGDDHLYFRECAETLLVFFSIAGFIIRGGFAHPPGQFLAFEIGSPGLIEPARHGLRSLVQLVPVERGLSQVTQSLSKVH